MYDQMGFMPKKLKEQKYIIYIFFAKLFGVSLVPLIRDYKYARTCASM